MRPPTPLPHPFTSNPFLPPDPDWTPAETAYLFSLLRAYDLRFLIVADRYAYLPAGSSSGQQAYPYPVPPAKASDLVKDGTGDVGRRSTRSAREKVQRAGKGKEESPLTGLGVTGVLGRDDVHESLKGTVKVRSLEVRAAVVVPSRREEVFWWRQRKLHADG